MNVRLQRRTFRVSRTNPTFRTCLAFAIALAVSGPAAADAVIDWSATTNTVIGAAGGPPQQWRITAMAHIAMHDALNAIDPRYRTYTAVPAGAPGASIDAAVARAARDVLAAQIPSQAATLDIAYASYIAGLAPCAPANPGCIAQGESVGAAAAQAILAARTLDGSETPHVPYTLAPGIGVYQPTLPTPPAGPFPQFGNWGNVKPFALGNAAQFHPGRTNFLRVSGAAYTRDYQEVKAVGNTLVRSAAPDSEESRIARYWPGGGANLNVLARTVLEGRGYDPWEHARVLALMYMAVSDGLVATFRTKYDYNFWRPTTAIRWLDDGNPDTVPDPAWTSYIVTPPYPDYTCGLPNTIGSATEVLRDFLGTDEVAYTMTAVGLPPAVTRSFTSLSQAADEAADARVFGGIHFRTGCEAAVRLGEKVGRFVWHTQLKPR